MIPLNEGGEYRKEYKEDSLVNGLNPVACLTYDKDPLIIAFGIGGGYKKAGFIERKGCRITYQCFTIMKMNPYLFAETFFSRIDYLPVTRVSFQTFNKVNSLEF